MTAEKIKKLIAELEQQQTQALANYQALGGAIQAYKEMLEEEEKENADKNG